MKITVVGGGSTYTPELAFELAEPGAPRVDELVLHDVDASRLDVVAGYVRRILDARGVPVAVHATTDLDAAVAGAAFVLTQVRVGGSAGRVLDETIPLRHGVIGQETTGAGGFAMALRTIPVVLDVAERMQRLAPGAFLVNFANPAGLVTEALASTGVRAVGLCNIPLTFERGFAAALAAPVEVDSFGLNHLSWIRSVRTAGRERIGEILAGLPEHGEVPRDVAQLLGMVPNPYLRYYYRPLAMLAAQQRARRTRAEEVVDIEQAALAAFADERLTDRPEGLGRRGGAWYCTAALGFVHAVTRDARDRQVLNVPNAGAIPGIPDDAVVEVPCSVGAAGAEPLPQPPVPEHCLALIRTVKAYERLTVEAARSGDRDVALLALATHPLVGDVDVAGPLLDDLLAAHRPYLPRFFPEGS